MHQGDDRPRNRAGGLLSLRWRLLRPRARSQHRAGGRAGPGPGSAGVRRYAKAVLAHNGRGCVPAVHTGQAQGAAPTASASAAPAAAQSPTAEVQITIIAHPGNVTWAQLTSRNGTVLFSGDVGAGSGLTQQTSTAVAGMTVQLGNPSGADLYLNGKKIPDNQPHPITLQCNALTCV